MNWLQKVFYVLKSFFFHFNLHLVIGANEKECNQNKDEENQSKEHEDVKE